MTQHTDLIERLRWIGDSVANEAATALEAQAREIEATERQVEILTDALAESRREGDGWRKDAALGRVAMRFVDRAGDVHPGIDDAETICAEFHAAMMAELETHLPAAMKGAPHG